MPPRRKPTSTRQKKAEQQLKRAIKRGDVPAPEPTKKNLRKKKGRLGPPGNSIGRAASSNTNVEHVRRLQSAFIKASPQFLEETKVLASSISLTRPIPEAKSVYDGSDKTNQGLALNCPRRPKWRFDMTKVEVEKNEEGIFKKWLAESDSQVGTWTNNLEEQRKVEGSTDKSMPPSFTHFERNLEVWRQLWRVTEISQLLLVLLDSRCPMLHYPPALSAYLEKRNVILILTKVDITGHARVEAWKAFLQRVHPGLSIVQVESYIEKDITAVHQGKKGFEPSIPAMFKAKLVEAIKRVHSELSVPPDRVQNDPTRLKHWISPVKRNIDWDALLDSSGKRKGHLASFSDDIQPEVDDELTTDDGLTPIPRQKEPDILTIGLIGQPNVGKSSLLNALFGESRVRASKTPGKTKHFQTLFWTSDVRLVDCPGLVIPNFIPMEVQVLTGVLPISRVSAISSCVHFAAQLLPLERILGLQHPSLSDPAVEDRRTWRDDLRPRGEKSVKALKWTAMDILTAYANSKGWVTAKAGRPDVHRAGNAILRALAEGRISWGFWPPGTESLDNNGIGIWIPRNDAIDIETDTDGDGDEEIPTDSETQSNHGSESESDEEQSDAGQNIGLAGRFGALALDAYDDSEASEE